MDGTYFLEKFLVANLFRRASSVVLASHRCFQAKNSFITYFMKIFFRFFGKYILTFARLIFSICHQI